VRGRFLAFHIAHTTPAAECRRDWLRIIGLAILALGLGYLINFAFY
jgi:hypothetical protein